MANREDLESSTPSPADEPDDPTWEPAWADEADRRFEELRSGKLRGIPAEEVFAGIRNRRSVNTSD